MKKASSIEQVNSLKKYGWIVGTEGENNQINLAGLILPLHEFLQKFDIANIYLTNSNNNTTVSSFMKKEFKTQNQHFKEITKVYEELKQNIDFLNAKAFCAFLSDVEQYEQLKEPSKKGHPLASFLLAKIYFRRAEIIALLKQTSALFESGFSKTVIMNQALEYLNLGFKQCNFNISEKQVSELNDDKNKLLLEVLVCSPNYTYNCLTKISFDNFCLFLEKLKQLPSFSAQSVDAFVYIRFMSKLLNEFDIEKLKNFSNSELETQLNMLKHQISDEQLHEQPLDEDDDDLHELKSSGRSSKSPCVIS